MANRSEGRTGWRDSAWNRRAAASAMGRNRLALAAGGDRSQEARREESGDGSVSLLGFLAAPWMAPVRHRYSSGNRRLMHALEWMTAKTWPLAVLDDMCTWFEDGSAASRMFVGCAAAMVMAALLTVHAASLSSLQALTLLPVFGGHGLVALVAASFLAGATILPAVVGHLFGVLLRFYILVNVCVLATLLGYGSWLLYSYAKF